MKKFCKEWKIRQALLSTYHPQPNQAERSNRNVVQLISSFINENHKTWDEHLQKFALALRTSVHDVTKFTPSLINLGREIFLPFDQQMSDDIFLSDIDLTQRGIEIPQELHRIVSWVKTQIVKHSEINKEYYDSKHRHVDYTPGDKVLVRNHTLSDKSSNYMRKLGRKLPNLT